MRSHNVTLRYVKPGRGDILAFTSAN